MLYINILIYDQISEIDVWGVSRIYRLLSVQGDIEEGILYIPSSADCFESEM